MTNKQNYDIYEDRRLGGIPRYFLGRPDDWNMYIPDEVRKCVVFVCVQDKDGDIVPFATGFLVSIPSEKNSSMIYIYLVTARHVAVEISDKKFWISVNNKDGVEARIESENTKWFYHPDNTDSVDLAVIPFPIHESFDFKTIPTNIFFNPGLPEHKHIGIGNEVFVIGLFHYFSGRKKIIPIVRMGNIAMLPDEKVPTQKFGDIDAYLIESRSISGLSGSPVFFCEEQTKMGQIKIGGLDVYLGGLVHGHWDVPEGQVDSFSLEDERSDKKVGINVGIAIITPAIKILETLNCDELKKMRTENDKKIEEKKLPVEDTTVK